MAKDPIKLKCGTCGGTGKVTKQYKGIPDPKTGKVETNYRTENCGSCGGRGTIN